MKYLFIVFAMFFSLQLCAKPIDGVYVEFGGGKEFEDKLETKNSLNYVYDKNYVADAIVGYQSGEHRFELEYSKRASELYSSGSLPADGDITQTTAMFNIYFSGYNKSKFISSIGIGAGISTVELDDKQNGVLKNDNIKSAQAMYAIGYMISDSFIVSTKYKYLYLKGSDDFKKRDNNILSLSFRYIF